MIVADYCTIKAKTWLVLADRFNRWVSVFYFPREATAKQLIKILRKIFSTFDVAESIATDEGSRFIANEMENLLTRWGVKHRISSDSETGPKRLLMTTTKSDGSPDWDNVSQALQGHRNTPIRDLNLSPARSFSSVLLSGICSR